VYDVVRQVPPGRVTTYGAIAAFLGTRLSARMVGWAMNASHQAIPEVPAQRVVNRNGMLSGRHHFPPDRPMEELLKGEGVDIVDDRVFDFPARFWDPAVELSL
jgi:methylated-DNA-protein-cysteine methyltransferase-like protein